MKPFDDSISEENILSYQDLTSLLHQITPTSSITAEEHNQLLMRVRTRLHQADNVSPDDTLFVPENLDNVSSIKRNMPLRFRRVRYTLNMIAAVLVIGVIVGASLFLFSSRQGSNSGSNIPTGAPVGPVKAPVTVRSQAGGLEASLHVTSGPYFLSELLDAIVTLTNRSNKSVFLQGSDASLNFCTGALSLVTTGGSDPHYNFSLNAVSISCPFFQTKLDPGKTLTAHGYVPLTKSGHVTLTPGAKFLTVKKDRYGEEGTSSGHSPLDGHWPIMRINVAAQIPVDRTLSLRQQGSQITINASASVKPHLVYYDTMTCIGTTSVSNQWTPLTTATLHEPGCSGANKHWTYAVSAPGYAIVLDEVSS